MRSIGSLIYSADRAGRLRAAPASAVAHLIRQEEHVANSRSARKRIRANERKHIRNRGVRSSVRTYVGKARQSLLSLEPGETIDVAEQLKAAVKALDRAAE